MNLFLVGILSLLHPQIVTVKTAGRGVVTVGLSDFRQGPVSFAGELLISTGGISRAYKGEVTVAASGGELRLIWKAELEDLVAAIVAAESPANAPPAALAAQAVLARSWLLASRGRHGAFDVCDTTHCQHFKEANAAGQRAAAETRNLALVWSGRMFAPAYSAACGGRTLTAREIGWDDVSSYPYFAVDCRVCTRQEPAWRRRLQGADAATVREYPHAENVRLAIGRRTGWDALPSNNYSFKAVSGALEIEGRGQGHGLGYCQRGGAGMALEGLSPAAILAHYFPGTAIKSLLQ